MCPFRFTSEASEQRVEQVAHRRIAIEVADQQLDSNRSA
jgi:hypothetical protein